MRNSRMACSWSQGDAWNAEGEEGRGGREEGEGESATKKLAAYLECGMFRERRKQETVKDRVELFEKVFAHR